MIVSRLFTIIAGLLFLFGAAVHAYRLYIGGFAISVAGHNVPLWVSWPIGGVAALLGIMLLVESRR
jgi:lipopolysaccharide export LptBFGC system permease protein LptF